MDTIRHHYETVVNRSTTLMEYQIEKITEQLQTLEAAIESAKITTPETDKEYLSLLKMSDTLNQRLFDITDRLLERLSPGFLKQHKDKGFALCPKGIGLIGYLVSCYNSHLFCRRDFRIATIQM